MKKMNDFPFQIFRAYDIRGKVEMMPPELIQAIAYALVDQLIEKGQSKITLGYDARLSSPAYAQIIKQVFQSKIH